MPRRHSLSRAIEALKSSVDPAKALTFVRPTRAFITAKLNGSSTPEARALAGISSQKKIKPIFQEPLTQVILEEALGKEKLFSDRGITKRLKEMWFARDTSVVEIGGQAMKVTRKNWDVRKFAFTNVLELRGLKNKKDDSEKLPQATQINFIVTPIPGVPNPSVDVHRAE